MCTMTAPARTGDADSRRPVGEAPAGIEGFGPHPGLVFDEAGAPYDAQHGDVFRNRNGAWEEAETVFVGGCRLRERWRECEHFTVFELGFGLGVNFLASLRAWRADPARCAALHFVSVESRPLSREDLRWGLESLGGLATDDAEALLAAMG